MAGRNVTFGMEVGTGLQACTNEMTGRPAPSEVEGNACPAYVTENDVPQLHECLAFGFSKRNVCCMRSDL